MSDWKEIAGYMDMMHRSGNKDATYLKVMADVEEHVKDLLVFGSTEIAIEVDHILDPVIKEELKKL